MSYRELTENLLKENFEKVTKARLKWRDEVVELIKSGTRDVYIFGAGQVAMHFYHDIKALGGKFAGFIDNNKNKWGSVIIDDVLCFSPEELSKSNNPLVVVGVGMRSKEVFDQLENMGVNDVLDATDFLFNFALQDIENVPSEEVAAKAASVFDLLADEKSAKVLYRKFQGFVDFTPKFGRPPYFYDIYEDKQYFPEDIVKFNSEDVFVDCGAYTGDTLEEFLKLKTPIKKYLAYELSKNNFETLKSNMTKISGGGGSMCRLTWASAIRTPKSLTTKIFPQAQWEKAATKGISLKWTIT